MESRAFVRAPIGEVEPRARQMSLDANGGVELSVVVPVFNEEKNIALLVDRVLAVLETMGVAHELIVVDDGSRDGTWRVISDAATARPRVRGLRLSRNFGHQHALLAGLSAARGRALVTMDGDLQHPPEVLPHLFRRWREGYRVVLAARNDATVATPFKRLTSRYFYRVFSALSGVAMSAGMSDFRLIDRSVRDELLSLRQSDLFLRGSVQWLGFETTTVPFQAAPRHAGETKYPLRRMLRFASGAIVSFSVKPLKLGIWLGVITGLGALVELIFVVVQYLRGITVPGWASVVGLMSLLFGVLFIVLGLIGTYLARIHELLQNRPAFVIEQRTGRPEDGTL
jgi:glycosyltransferase involved in cell wall biosynthesis